MSKLSHLERLEAESIHIMREVVAECERPVMLYSIGKDSSVMLHLALKAFYPAPPPFPLLHVDTTWKFREMIEFRDQTARRLGLELLVHTNPEGVAQGINPFDHGSAVHTDIMKTQALQAGARPLRLRRRLRRRAARRGEAPRQGARLLVPLRAAPLGPEEPAARSSGGSTTRVEQGREHPRLPAVELDRARRLAIHPPGEHPDRAALLRQASGRWCERDGTLIMVDDERMPLAPGEKPKMRKVRFRTLGCYPLTGAIESDADTLPEIIEEMLAARTSERQGRRDRPRRGRLDGEEEAGRLFLMSARAAAALARVDAGRRRSWLAAQAGKELLRFITCGSVDDGKSTLIGRLLYESQDDLRGPARGAREPIRRKVGTQGGELDFALLVDGLAAEREQGITIDVAYRFFSTDAAQVHRRRHARPRAVHAQHGHRRLDRASWPSS